MKIPNNTEKFCAVRDFFNKCLCRDPGASTINYMNFVDFVI